MYAYAVTVLVCLYYVDNSLLCLFLWHLIFEILTDGWCRFSKYNRKLQTLFSGMLLVIISFIRLLYFFIFQLFSLVSFSLADRVFYFDRGLLLVISRNACVEPQILHMMVCVFPCSLCQLLAIYFASDFNICLHVLILKIVTISFIFPPVWNFHVIGLRKQ